MFQKTQRLSRFPLLRDLLPANIPSVDEIQHWGVSKMLAGRLGDNRQMGIWNAVRPELRSKEWRDLTAYARFTGEEVDFFVWGYDANAGLIGAYVTRASGRTSLLHLFSDQGLFDNRSAEYGYKLEVDLDFTPRPLSECARLSRSCKQLPAV